MTEPSPLPDGAFVPAHGKGFLKPAPRFQKGNKASVGNKGTNGFSRQSHHSAASALRSIFPALADALKAPPLTKRAWWRRKRTTLLIAYSGNLEQTERHLLSLVLLRNVQAPQSMSTETCAHCGQRLQGDTPTPLITAALVSGWTHVRCHTAATQAIVMKARLALAQALTPHK